MGGMILKKITIWLLRRKKIASEEAVDLINKEISDTFRFFVIKPDFKKDLDLKPVILKWFYCSYWINLIFTAFIIFANAIYIALLLYIFFGIKFSGIPKDSFSIPWIGTVIINSLFVIFLIRVFSDCYKLSLKANYRNQYLKLLRLDIITLNLFSIIGSLLFLKHKHKNYLSNITADFKIVNNNLNLQTIKHYLKAIFQIDFLILIINLFIFITTILIGYFVPINIIKIIFWILFFLNFLILSIWSIPRIIAFLIIQTKLKKLVNNKSYYYFVTVVRFLVFNLGSYYIATLVIFLKFDEDSKELIMENW